MGIKKMSDSDRKKGASEDEIASKLITVGYKRFYVDVKQNTRGRFIKIAEVRTLGLGTVSGGYGRKITVSIRWAPITSRASRSR